jgi:hypothetical protein
MHGCCHRERNHNPTFFGLLLQGLVVFFLSSLASVVTIKERSMTAAVTFLDELAIINIDKCSRQCPDILCFVSKERESMKQVRNGFIKFTCGCHWGPEIYKMQAHVAIVSPTTIAISTKYLTLQKEKT